MEKIPMTVRGEQMLRERLKQLREVDRPQNVRDIEEARAHGDLSENAEYHAAKERQGLLDAQIREVEDRLSRAQVIDSRQLSGQRVVFGAFAVLEDLESGEEVTYQIVGTEDADPKQGRISYTAPLARAIIGRSVGDSVRFQTPGGEREFDILEVRFE